METNRRGRRGMRDWLVDSVFFLFAVASGLGFVVQLIAAPRYPAALLVADVVAGSMACLALWFRRRWPVGVGFFTAPIGFFSGMGGMAAAVSMFTVCVHRRWPIALLIGGIHALAIPALALLHRRYAGLPYGEWTGSIWSDVLLTSVVHVAVLGWGFFVRARRQLVSSLRDRAERAEVEQQLRVEQAKHTERERIAREMHDVLAHRISLLSLHAGSLEFRPDAPAAEVARAAAVIRNSAHVALTDLREVIGVLRGSEDDDNRPQPTLANVAELVEESRQSGTAVDLAQSVPDVANAPAGLGRTVYRITQEALTNARKHATGTKVDVRVAGSPGTGVTVEVRNPLPGSAPLMEQPGARAGLIGLTERAELAGGWLDHGPTTGGEFRIRAWLPWPGKTHGATGGADGAGHGGADPAAGRR